MKKSILISNILLFLILFTQGCEDKTKLKINYKHTICINNILYVEKFCPLDHGVYGGSTNSYWVTDSVNQWIYIGFVDDNEAFNFDIQNQYFIAKRYKRILTDNFEIYTACIDSIFIPLDSFSIKK